MEKRAWQRSSGGGRWAHSSANRMKMVCKRVIIEGSRDFMRTVQLEDNGRLCPLRTMLYQVCSWWNQTTKVSRQWLHIEACHTLPWCRISDTPMYAIHRSYFLELGGGWNYRTSINKAIGHTLYWRAARRTRQQRKSTGECRTFFFSVNGDFGLSGHFCAAQIEEGCLALQDFQCQSHFSRPGDNYVYICLQCFDNHVLSADNERYCLFIFAGCRKFIINYRQVDLLRRFWKGGLKHGALG